MMYFKHLKHIPNTFFAGHGFGHGHGFVNDFGLLSGHVPTGMAGMGTDLMPGTDFLMVLGIPGTEKKKPSDSEGITGHGFPGTAGHGSRSGVVT